MQEDTMTAKRTSILFILLFAGYLATSNCKTDLPNIASNPKKEAINTDTFQDNQPNNKDKVPQQDDLTSYHKPNKEASNEDVNMDDQKVNNMSINENLSQRFNITSPEMANAVVQQGNEQVVLNEYKIDRKKKLDDRAGDGVGTSLGALSKVVNTPSGTGTLTTKKSAGSDCEILPSKKSISSFRHNVYYYHLNFVYLKLSVNGNLSLDSADGVIGGDTWVWTYYGKEGALEFLQWPFEFEIWSMGLLAPYVRGPMEVTLHQAGGTCKNLIVGHESSETIISKALVQLPQSIMNISEEMKEQYGPSFFCYKSRMFLNPHFLYDLCKHIVCPLEAIKYECCRYVFSQRLLKRVIACDRRPFDYDSLWWVWPIVIAVILFAYIPLVLMFLGSKLSAGFSRRQQNGSLRNLASNVESDLRIIHLGDTFPVTLFSTIWGPIASLCTTKCSQSSRIFRFFMPFLSLSIIILQIVLDTYYLHGFVLDSIKQGVPLGFRSMAAGYHDSKDNFMFYFGGPFVALAIYLTLTCIAVTLPSALSTFLAGGLQNSNSGSESRVALIFDLKMVERLGSIPIVRIRGFHRIYNTYLGQFYMLLNVKFWKEVLAIQTNRWNNFAYSRVHYILFPFYVLLCLGEVILCISINGFPLISFVITINRAYSFYNVIGGRSKMRICRTILSLMLTVLLFLAVLFFLYMFCTIFMDATLFVCRLFMFTYTGIVIYPKLSYGYLIFGFTVFYYLWDCVTDYSKFYWKVLKVTVSACEYTQRKFECDVLVVVDNERHLKGVKESIFEHVIETHCPRRKQVFVSILKLTIILGIIGVSIGLLTKTDKFQELHVLMHVGTALFTCALPVILKSMCRGPEKSYRNKKFEIDVRKTVAEFVGYFMDDSEDTDAEID